MASLTVRRLPDDIKQELRELAARHGRSLEEEVRQTLIALVRPGQKAAPKSIGQMLYEASRPGGEWPEIEDTAASAADFDA